MNHVVSSERKWSTVSLKMVSSSNIQGLFEDIFHAMFLLFVVVNACNYKFSLFYD